MNNVKTEQINFNGKKMKPTRQEYWSIGDE